ncbi:NAD(P)-binding domain-containing protein [Amylibacter sp.]|nr:NAD(P)-binding domain-containing protein [Amylibacter sp.]
MKQKIAVIGLGSMGYGIASSCLRSGNAVWGVDIDIKQVKRFWSLGGQKSQLDSAIKDIDVVIVVVLNSIQTESVLFSGSDGGVVACLKPGSVVISCATVAPNFAKEMELRCKKFGVLYLDAPVSGGALKAANGQLSIMASGSKEAFRCAQKTLNSISETVFELGYEAGAGSAMKAVNQLLAGVHISAMAEALTFGISQGVTPAKFVEVISKCAGTSWMLENRAPHIVSGDYTPHSSVNIWPKDLGIVLDVAKNAKFDVPIASAALKQFKTAVDMGLGLEDDAAVAKVYAKSANLSLPKKL